MSNRCTIDIDMDRMEAEMRCDALSSTALGKRVETTTAELVGLCLLAEVRRLMHMSRDELAAEHLKQLQEALK